MQDVAIRIQNLSKQYFIGVAEERADSFPDAVMRVLSSPFQRLNRPSRTSRSHAELWALNDVSFDVMQGEVFGIVGRNGSGKSTLLKILSRITEPTSGEISITGRVASLLEVGTGFHPELTGRENIYLNGAILGMKRVEIVRKFDEIVEFSEIARFLDTPVKHYSSGMYTRLAFAVAAHLDPEILLVDEVLAVGDIDFQKKCIGRMEKVSRQGHTVVVVSHSMSTVKALCSRAAVLQQGKLSHVGAVEDVIAGYLSAHQADLAEKEIIESNYALNSGKMQVQRVRLLNGCGGAFRVYWKQAFQVQVDIEVTQDLEDVAFGMGIRGIDGTHIFHVHHDDGVGAELWSLSRGTYTIEFTVENNLRPGMYKLHLMADQRHLRTSKLFELDAVTIDVLDHSLDGELPVVANSGIVNGRSLWREPVRHLSNALVEAGLIASGEPS